MPKPDVTPQSPTQAYLTCTECAQKVAPTQQYCLECGAPTRFAVPLRRISSGAGKGAVAGLMAIALAAGGLVGRAATRDRPAQEAAGTTAPPMMLATGATAAIPAPAVPPVATATEPAPLPTFTETAATATETEATPPEETTPAPAITAPSTPAGATTSTPTGSATPPGGNPFDPPEQVTPDPEATDPAVGAATTNSRDTTVAVATDDWTATTPKYTIILRSFTDRPGAEDKVDEVRSVNFTAGVLVSSNYSSLRPGYFAVFHGVFDTPERAKAEAVTLRQRFPSAYARRIAK